MPRKFSDVRTCVSGHMRAGLLARGLTVPTVPVVFVVALSRFLEELLAQPLLQPKKGLQPALTPMGAVVILTACVTAGLLPSFVASYGAAPFLKVLKHSTCWTPLLLAGCTTFCMPRLLNCCLINSICILLHASAALLALLCRGKKNGPQERRAGLSCS
jgi:hypothetical protein